MKIKQSVIDEMVGAGVPVVNIAKRLGISKQAFYARQRSSSWRRESVMCFAMVASTLTGNDYTAENVVDTD